MAQQVLHNACIMQEFFRSIRLILNCFIYLICFIIIQTFGIAGSVDIRINETKKKNQ